MWDVEINYLAVFVAALVPMIVGMIWYSPALFGTTWMNLIGKKKEELAGNAKTGYLWSFLASLLFSYVMAHFVELIGVATVSEGLQLGFWAWLGFALWSALGDYVYAGRAMGVYWINAGYQLVCFLAVAAVLTVWI